MKVMTAELSLGRPVSAPSREYPVPAPRKGCSRILAVQSIGQFNSAAKAGVFRVESSNAAQMRPRWTFMG
jgi:hypothetical protein